MTERFDLVVYGGTPGGIACAVRAAREGLSVLLVTHTPHLGGMLTSGLCVWDTQYEGRRSPIYDELRASIFEYYRTAYGEDSKQYWACLPGPSGHSNGNFEPRVAKALVEEMVEREPGITVVRRHYPVEAEREDRVLRRVAFRKMGEDHGFRVEGKAFADCSYEGDLMAVAGAKYRVGRESREAFGEPHAGRIFVRPCKEAPNEHLRALGEAHDKLRLRPFPGFQEIVKAEGSGCGDGRVQAYNWRTMLTPDPANRLPPYKPANYDPERYKTLEKPSLHNGRLPNGKIRVNRPQLIGRQNPYVEGSWETRKQVMDEHWDALMGCLHFLQNDLSLREDVRAQWREWGLPNDEFEDNDHRPYEIYARETRRLEGRYVFTEHDASLVPGIGRAPIHPDSIAVTEWYIDIHACTEEKLPSTLHEGKIMLHQETFPGQVPYRAILPQEIDNLLVPVCVSSSHAGWGTIRLEPTWMNIGEAAGLAAALAANKGMPPAQIDADELVRTLANKRVMISFYNDIDVSSDEPWIPAIQYFGTKGFFSSYDVLPDQPLSGQVAKVWAEAFGELRNGRLDPMATACKLHGIESGGEATTVEQLKSLLPAKVRGRITLRADQSLTRGDACRLLFALLAG